MKMEKINLMSNGINESQLSKKANDFEADHAHFQNEINYTMKMYTNRSDETTGLALPFLKCNHPLSFKIF